MNWDENASAKGFPVNGTATVGAIAQWEANSPPALGAGHVAVVEVANSDFIEVTEDNWGGGTKRRRIEVGHAHWPDHFIHIKDVGNANRRLGTYDNRMPLDFNGDDKTDILYPDGTDMKVLWSGRGGTRSYWSKLNTSNVRVDRLGVG